MCKAMNYKNKYAICGEFKTSPGAIKRMNQDYLTNEKLTKFITGEILDMEDYNRIEKILESNQEYYISDFFYYNDITLIDNEYMKLKIRSNYRPITPAIQLNPDYNILLDYITDLDSVWYYSETILYNMLVPEDKQQQAGQITTEQDALNLLCYQITQEYLENNYTEDLTREDIQQEFKDYKEDLPDINQDKLFNLILDAWKELIKDLSAGIEEALYQDDGEYMQLLLSCEECAVNALFDYINQSAENKVLYEEIL